MSSWRFADHGAFLDHGLRAEPAVRHDGVDDQAVLGRVDLALGELFLVVLVSFFYQAEGIALGDQVGLSVVSLPVALGFDALRVPFRLPRGWSRRSRSILG